METTKEQPATPPHPTASWKSLLSVLGIGAVIATSLYRISPFPLNPTLHTPKLSETLEPLNPWLESEQPIALASILANIGPSPKVAGAQPGIVVASPSKSNPDYFYTWTRDSALTIKTLVDEFVASKSPDLEVVIQDYIRSQAILQGIENPSGSLCSGGLGEAKFNVDETAFTGDWGRPQRDGPALRAIALIAYARYLLSEGGANDTVSAIIWPILQNDLSYVTQHWSESTFDLWEEVKGASFFTTAMQFRALVEGSRLARNMGKACPHCDSQAPQILCFLQTYWTTTDSYVVSNTGGGRSGKDVNSILACTHLFDPDAACDAVTFQPCSDKALANHKVVTDSFRAVFEVNAGVEAGVGVAVGRYPEDVYMGGNPWYLSAFAAAEMLYQAVFQWKHLGAINVTATSHSSFKDVYPSVKLGTYAAPSAQFDEIIEAVTSYADSYMANARKYTPSSGSLAKQYSRHDGAALSARDLTWSYAAFLTAYNARKGVLPASWGASSIDLPHLCSSSSATGPCSTATIPPWPSRTAPAPCTPPTLTTVMFSVLKRTVAGEDLFLSGSIPQLGSWDAAKALPLSAGKYTERKPAWYAFERLPVGAVAEYKYFLKAGDGKAVTWEGGVDRRYIVTESCEVVVLGEDEWL